MVGLRFLKCALYPKNNTHHAMRPLLGRLATNVSFYLILNFKYNDLYFHTFNKAARFFFAVAHLKNVAEKRNRIDRG